MRYQLSIITIIIIIILISISISNKYSYNSLPPTIMFVDAEESCHHTRDEDTNCDKELVDCDQSSSYLRRGCFCHVHGYGHRGET